MAKIFIALGTNIEDRVANLELAIERLSEVMRITDRSRLYQSDPMYVEDQAAFLNMAVTGETKLSPEQLLVELKRLEHEIGRRPTYRNGPRVIDLDILYYDDVVMDTEPLIIPHPRIDERGFVLLPMMDLDPEWMDLRQNKRISEMADKPEIQSGLEVYKGC